MSTAPIVFIDTETTGLDPERHELWEIGLIEADGTEHVWRMAPRDLHRADENALRLTRFYERIEAAGYHEETIEEGYPKRTRTVKRPNFWTPQTRRKIAHQVVTLTAGKHIVGAVPWFDARFLSDFLRSEDFAPAWHYHLIDVEALAVGYLNAALAARPIESTTLQPPWDSHALSRALGIPGTPAEDRHTALGDARWAKAIYEKVMGA